MTYTRNMIQAFKHGYTAGYLKAIEDFEKLTKTELPEEVKSAWEILSLIPKEKGHDKNHRNE